jgi:hypothetical protein
VVNKFDENSEPQSLDPNVVAKRFSSLHGQIADQLTSLPDALNFRGDTDSDTDDEQEKDISELVSVLDKELLPHELNKSLASEAPSFEGSLSKMVTPGDPIATIWVLARHDMAFADRLRNAITPQMRAKHICFKLRARVDEELEALDEYSAEGSREVDEDLIPNVAQAFRKALAQLIMYLHAGSHDTDVYAYYASGLAVTLLRLAQQRDIDIYEGLSAHDRITFAPSHQENCNLFMNLFSQPSTTEHHFFPTNLVKLLRDDSVRRHLRGHALEELRTILNELGQKYEVVDTRLRPTSMTEFRYPSVTRFRDEVQTILASLPGESQAGESAGPSRGLRHRPSDLPESTAQRRRTQR